MPEAIRKGAVVPVEIDSLAYGGAGVGRVDGFVVFVEGAAPGDRVLARILKKQSNHAQAEIDSIERPSPSRVSPPCLIFDRCGGCSWQHLPYEEQLEWKRRQVEETIARLAGSAPPPVPPPLPSPAVWNYRNKMEYSFGTGPGGETILGFHTPGRFDEIFEVPACLIHPKPFDSLLSALTRIVRAKGLSAYNQRRHTGFLRHCLMRHSLTTGGVMAMLITNDGSLGDPAEVAAELKAACPELQAFVWAINRGLADVAVPQEIRFCQGDPVLKETVNGLTFAISPRSFFQTNTRGAERLYALVAEMAELTGTERVLDAFCGAGAIGLHCAAKAKIVAGVETVKEAVWDARANAEANGIRNARFIAAPVNEGLALARQAAGGDFQRVIIDPPRGGIDRKSLAQLIALRAPVFLYVSCNPSTLARDLQTLREGGYETEAVQPVDMFPHTYHIETVVRLRFNAAMAPPAHVANARR